MMPPKIISINEQKIKNSKFHPKKHSNISKFNDLIQKQQYSTRQSCKIPYHQYQNTKLKDLFLMSQQVDIKLFSLAFNFERDILNHMHSINFPYLKQLTLNSNAIRSIELLCGIGSPQIEILRIHYNQIVSISPLKHCYLPKLKILQLHGNFYREMDYLSQMNSLNLNQLILQQFNNDNVIEQGIKWIVKLQSKNCKQLSLKVRDRKTIQKLQKKFNDNIKIRLC